MTDEIDLSGFGHRPGTKIVFDSEGNPSLITPEQRIDLASDGVSINLQEVRSVGIKNILDLSSYTVSREGDRVMHHFRFASGAEGEITYLNSGRLEVFRVDGGCKVSTTPDGDVTLAMGQPAEQEK